MSYPESRRDHGDSPSNRGVPASSVLARNTPRIEARSLLMAQKQEQLIRPLQIRRQRGLRT